MSNNLAFKDEESQQEIKRLLQIHERNKVVLTEINDEIALDQRWSANKNSTCRESIFLKKNPWVRLNLVHIKGDSLLFQFFRGTYDISYTYVRVKDASSGKYHFLSVPNGMRTCQAAIAWTFGVSPSEYRPSLET